MSMNEKKLGALFFTAAALGTVAGFYGAVYMYTLKMANKKVLEDPKAEITESHTPRAAAIQVPEPEEKPAAAAE